MRKVIVIGHFDWRGNNMIGAVVKARNIFEELQQFFGEACVSSVDIYEWRKRKVNVLLEILKAFFSTTNIVLVCSDTSTILMRIFSILKTVRDCSIHYCVVGGDIAELLSEHPKRLRMLKCIDSFFVETEDCVEKLEDLGVLNVKLLRNFKRIHAINKLQECTDEPFRFCTFSRVIEQKGITDAILAINKINDEKNRIICTLDIYGPIDSSYRDKFESLLQMVEAVKYCGIVDSNNSVEILKDYYCLLFPTKYQTEGIPGTIIDGFAAGVPVICADWVRCRQLITDGRNGIVYPFNDFDSLVEKIKFAIGNPEYVMELRKGCLVSFSEYRPEEAIKPLLKELV